MNFDKIFGFSLPQSRYRSTAPSSEGAKRTKPAPTHKRRSLHVVGYVAADFSTTAYRLATTIKNTAPHDRERGSVAFMRFLLPFLLLLILF